MVEQNNPSDAYETQSNPERWVMPVGAFIIDSAAGIRVTNINPTLRSVLTKEGQQIGQVFEATIEANSGEEQALLEFRISNPGKCDVLTSGWQSWSTSVAAAPAILPAEKLIGRKLYKKSLGGKTVPYFEPGPGGEKIPPDEGRSYGWVGFRDLKGGDNTVLGVIPSFDSLEDIRYRQEGDQIIVSVRKNLEGVNSQRPVTFKVFLGHVDRYADLMMVFSGELSRLRGNVPLMKDRVIGFSWAAYGPAVTQKDIQQEIKAGGGIYDTYVIDDGWETVSGSLTVDQDKFPDLGGLAQQMKQAGIKPGIWVAPFKRKGGTGNLPREWFMQDEHGKPMKTPLPQPLKLLENSFQFDVSVPEFRAYSIDKLLDLAKMGFEVFKADFLAAPFTGELRNKDKTSVQYYRQYFEEFRQRVRDELGKEIEIIGCGASVMESVGLFEGMRISPDSALQNLGNFINQMPLSRLWASRTNTDMYKGATSVSAHRVLPCQGAYGLILDGIHIVDNEIPLDSNKKRRLNQSMQAFNRLGIGNIFVGDSLARAGEQGKQVWRDFISIIKRGNEELVVDGDRLPEIPERFAPPKAA